MTKRAVVVARVSSQKQKDNFSLPSQLKAMRHYAADNDMTIAEEIQDVVSGAIEIRARSGGARLYELVENHEIDAVIFYTIDRVARDEDVAELIILKRDLRRAGIELHFCDSGKSDNSTMNGIVDYIKASNATEERRKIRERIKRGIHEKAQQKLVCGGHTIFGYRKVGAKKDAQLVIDEEEAATVRRIFAEYIGADGGDPQPLLRIARNLTLEKVKPPRRKNGHIGRGWWMVTVHAIVKRKAYYGEFHYAGHVLHIPELAIIPREWWEEAQARLEKNKRRSSRNQWRHYLLAGFMKCSCGGTLVGINTRGKEEWTYYFCNNAGQRRHLSNCREKRIRADVAEQVVWEWIVNLLTDEEQLKRGLRRMAEQDIANSKAKHERLGTVRELVVETEAIVKGLVADLAVLADASDVARASIRNQIKEKSRLLKSLTAERDRLEAELERLELTPEQEQRILAEAAAIRQGIREADFETKRFILDKLNFEAKYRRDDTGRWLDASCALAVGPVSLQLNPASQSNQDSINLLHLSHASKCKRGS